MLRKELEILTGSLISGDITPFVFSLIKDSPYLDDILPKKRKTSKPKKTGSNYTTFDSFIRRYGDAGK